MAPEEGPLVYDMLFDKGHVIQRVHVKVLVVCDDEDDVGADSFTRRVVIGGGWERCLMRAGIRHLRVRQAYAHEADWKQHASHLEETHCADADVVVAMVSPSLSGSVVGAT